MASRAAEDEAESRWPPELVDAVRAAIVTHDSGDDREAAAKKRFLQAIDTLPHPFDERADLVHVTGSAVVVGRRGTVLHLHKRLHQWMQPGGHVDPGEGPWDAAHRESEEETGLVLAHPVGGARLIHVDVHRAAGDHEHLDLRYLLLAQDADPAPPLGESPEVRWFSWDEAMEMADVALVGALRVARRQPEVAAWDGSG
ncbi:MAG: NUDIX hydrolase [Acidimicrobiales bacterium]